MYMHKSRLSKCEWQFNNPKTKSQLKQLKQFFKQCMSYLSGTTSKNFHKVGLFQPKRRNT